MMEQHNPTTTYYDQSGCDARFEWGVEGIRRLAPLSDVVVIVDVLSFSTCVDVAVARGATVFPYRWRDESAETFAQEKGAALAVSRGQTTAERPYSLSPVSLEALPPETRLVLPSPNGSTLAFLAADCGAVIAGCVRNARAVAATARALGQTVTVIAAGERWDGSDEPLRPAIEDMVGAGAILAALRPTAPSPEAIAAIAVYAAAAAALLPFIAACSSGRELAALGYAGDVEIAAHLDASETVPLLRDGAFISSPLPLSIAPNFVE
ncbi:MAG: 2-phosphosulfolactate phosphatase [Thermomicrobiales bacterium]